MTTGRYAFKCTKFFFKKRSKNLTWGRFWISSLCNSFTFGKLFFRMLRIFLSSFKFLAWKIFLWMTLTWRKRISTPFLFLNNYCKAFEFCWTWNNALSLINDDKRLQFSLDWLFFHQKKTSFFFQVRYVVELLRIRYKQENSVTFLTALIFLQAL